MSNKVAWRTDGSDGGLSRGVYGFVTIGCRWTRKPGGGWHKSFIYRAVDLRGKPEKRTSHE